MCFALLRVSGVCLHCFTLDISVVGLTQIKLRGPHDLVALEPCNLSPSVTGSPPSLTPARLPIHLYQVEGGMGGVGRGGAECGASSHQGPRAVYGARDLLRVTIVSCSVYFRYYFIPRSNEEMSGGRMSLVCADDSP